MCNPDKYPLGTKGFFAVRPQPITPRKYFNRSVFDIDGRLARDVEYLLTAQYAVEAKQIIDDANNYVL